jgi:Ca-activated chloride channel family protein
MKDEAGNPVTSRLNAETMRKLALDGGGSYYQATLQGVDMSSFIKESSSLQRGKLAVEKIRRFKPLYQYFLFPGILFITLAWFLPERRSAE